MSYVALDRAIWTSTVLKEGPLVVATWLLLLADADRYGETRATPASIASVLRVKDAEVEKAFKVLASPDPKSRNKEDKGCRMIELEDGRWRLTSFEKYKALATRAGAAERQKRYEERKKELGPHPLMPKGGRPKLEVEGYKLIREICKFDPKLSDLDGAQVLIECAGWTDRDGAFRSKARLESMSDDHLLRTLTDLRARLEDVRERTGK